MNVGSTFKKYAFPGHRIVHLGGIASVELVSPSVVSKMRMEKTSPGTSQKVFDHATAAIVFFKLMDLNNLIDWQHPQNR